MSFGFPWWRAGQEPLRLEAGATVAVIGGGPSGAFFALALLRRARELSRSVNVVIFERRSGSTVPQQTKCGLWQGCNYCAGGISPKLHDVLTGLKLTLPDGVIQNRIQGITIQGFWKNIEIEVPPDRHMLSIFRGSRPACITTRVHSFDSFLLEQACAEGARLISSEVLRVTRSTAGKPCVAYRAAPGEALLEADFCAFACGMNEHGMGHKPKVDAFAAEPDSPMLASARMMMPEFVPPHTRRTLIFELGGRTGIPASLRGSIFFVEYGSRDLPLEMCSLLPKRDCITVVLIGEAVDCAETMAEKREVMRGFLRLPHIQRLLSPMSEPDLMCVCGPRMVVGNAHHPFSDRCSAVGDMVTSRLYKDGILSAQRTASALAETVLTHGIGERDLTNGYGPTLRHFRRNNRFAAVVFFLHRILFSSSILSRILYQAVISERKSTPAPQRQLENILWRIASGDDEYEQIFRAMVRPATVRAVIGGGGLVTLRNYLTELAFGLKWEGFGRFTTGVSLERLEEKRTEFRRLIAQADIMLPERLEFERMYTIKIAAPRGRVLRMLERFGEKDRPYLRPRGVRITRVAGSPHSPGCIIRYELLFGRMCFNLRLEKLFEGRLAVYRVLDGFARGGVLLFDVETTAKELSLLSIYVAFNFKRGGNLAERLMWRSFGLLFPSFVHDVLWNHSLCQLRDVVERQTAPKPAPPANPPQAPVPKPLSPSPGIH